MVFAIESNREVSKATCVYTLLMQPTVQFNLLGAVRVQQCISLMTVEHLIINQCFTVM